LNDKDSLSKALLNEIMNYCMVRDYKLSQEFTLALVRDITLLHNSGNFNEENILELLSKQSYFLKTNNIGLFDISNCLFQRVKLVLLYYPVCFFMDILIEFKHEVERTLFRAFSVTKMPQEETGRTLLQSFLPQRGYREVQTGGGQVDLMIFGENQHHVIETKIWRGIEKYYEGLEELTQYLSTERIKEGYYIIFENLKGDCKKVKEECSEIYKEIHKGKIINVIFIKINPVAPSKKRIFDKEAIIRGRQSN